MDFFLRYMRYKRGHFQEFKLYRYENNICLKLQANKQYIKVSALIFSLIFLFFLALKFFLNAVEVYPVILILIFVYIYIVKIIKREPVAILTYSLTDNLLMLDGLSFKIDKKNINKFSLVFELEDSDVSVFKWFLYHTEKNDVKGLMICEGLGNVYDIKPPFESFSMAINCQLEVIVNH
jgi:hypothetical protein